ncbi:MAG TPA: FAD-binding oxidoreductase [Syntrophorhabdales bacterium]|nr:FAD-binding oxidoreductase [Syntrophorhabdales bacterium]
MALKDDIAKIVGKENVSDAEKERLKYSRDHSLVPAGLPDAVAYPKDSQEVSAILKYCNTKNIPVVPVSSRQHFYGSTIPKQGGVVLDLSRMNRIQEINESDRTVRIEAGVTWEQLTQELAKKGMRMIMPLLPPSDRSVLTDWLEREVPTNTVYDYGEPMQAMEVVWPGAEPFRLGSASVNGFPDSKSRGGNPSGPGIDFYRFVQGAQGTMGIVTWSHIKIEWIPKIDKIFFAPVTDLENAIDFLHRILPRRIGQECLLLNAIDLAAILAEKWPEDFNKLAATLPSWTLILVLSGLQRRPEEKIAYEEKFLSEVLRNEFKDLVLTDALPGFPGAARKLLPLLRKPWPSDVPYWKNRWRGASQSLFFIARPGFAPLFVDVVKDIAASYDYRSADIGIYIQPIEHNRACQLEFTFFYDKDNGQDVALVTSLYRNAASALMEEGAFFSRPYGELADMVYARAGGYVAALKRVKKVFDPKNIMNPGNLCF